MTGLISEKIEDVKEDGGQEAGVEKEDEPAGLSECVRREEEDAFLRGRVSKESGRGEGMRQGGLTGSGEGSFAFCLPPKTVLREDEALALTVPAFKFPSFVGVPVLGNVHFFLMMVQGWQTVPLSAVGWRQARFKLAQHLH